MEKIMYDRLNNYIVQNNFLHPLQHGFQSGHSTEMALMNLQDKITESPILPYLHQRSSQCFKKLNFILFADDTNLLASHKSLDELVKIA